MPTFKNEVAPDLTPSGAAATVQQQPQLDKDRSELEEKIEKLEERLESLGKLLSRSLESRLHNKVNELQEEICQRKFDLLVGQLHLAAVRSQLQLFEYNYRPNLHLQAQTAAFTHSATMNLLNAPADGQQLPQAVVGGGQGVELLLSSGAVAGSVAMGVPAGGQGAGGSGGGGSVGGAQASTLR